MNFPFKTILCIDFETRWGRSDYTLSKLTTEHYIRDERFKAFGCCIHEYGTDKPTQWYGHKELPKIFRTYDWSKTAVLAHNAMFDVAILSMIYGVKPAFIFDSLSMARALRGVEVGNSLAKLAKEFELPPKGNAVHSTDGLTEISWEVEQELAEYCKHDVFLCEEIFTRLLTGMHGGGKIADPYPSKELRLIDLTMKMFTNPQLELDVPMLQKAMEEENKKLQDALDRVGVSEAELASNDQFALVLEKLGVLPPSKKKKPTLKTPNPVGENFAFAKNDAHFQQMLNGDNEDVALLCEARLRVKSTLERTRAQRFIDIASRGPLPVPLAYYGAETGRWQAAKGGSINFQNMKRGSFLRKSIMAPHGYVIVVGDLSQIEPRVLAWVAGYDVMLETFRAGGDPYATFGSQMFSIPGLTKDTHPLLRQSAKSALLGCFGSQTPVLTKRGWVTIVDVTTEDLLWDGVEWVAHQGLLEQGEKEVLTQYGVSATSDHAILTEHGWQEWNAVLQKPSLFQSALSLANLPASGGVGKEPCITPSCAVAAAGKAWYTVQTSNAASVPAAGSALERKASKRATQRKDTLRPVQTARNAIGSLIASARSLCAVPTPPAKRIQTTAGAASQYIQNGLQTALLSLPTLSRFPVGTSHTCSLTASTTTAGTAPETYASLHVVKTGRTSGAILHAPSKCSTAASRHLKQRMQTYDIAQAGPRNRFTILTDAGPLIVHNCGYQLGWASFSAQLLVGFLGAPPQRYTKDDAKQLGVTSATVDRFINNKWHMEKMMEIPHTCTDQELLIHCLAAKAIVEKYRSAAEPVVDFWKLLQERIITSLMEGEEYEHKGVFTMKKEEIVLVNGMSLKYPNIEIVKDERGRAEYRFGLTEKKQKLYAGRICNNIVQGLARIVMSDGMLRVAKQYDILGTVHDELLALVPEDDAVNAKKWVHGQMTLEPKWLPGIPLNADVGYAVRYGEAK